MECLASALHLWQLKSALFCMAQGQCWLTQCSLFTVVNSFSFHRSLVKSGCCDLFFMPRVASAFPPLLPLAFPFLLLLFSFPLLLLFNSKPSLKRHIAHRKKLWYFPRKVYNRPPYVFNLFILSLELFFSLNGFHLFLSKIIKMNKLRRKEIFSFLELLSFNYTHILSRNIYIYSTFEGGHSFDFY